MPPVVGASHISVRDIEDVSDIETDVGTPGAVVATVSAEIVITNVSVSESPSVSVTLYVTVVLPTVVGVPEITLVLVLKDSPAGNGEAV